MQDHARPPDVAVPHPRGSALQAWLRARPAAVGRWVLTVGRVLLAPLAVDVASRDAPRPRTSRWLVAVDIVTAGTLYAMTAAALVDDDLRAAVYPPQILHLVAAAGTLPIAFRRFRPLLAWQIVLVATVVTSGWIAPVLLGAGAAEGVFGQGGQGEVPGGFILGPPVFMPGHGIGVVLCLYTVAARTPRRIATGAWLWSLLGLVVVAAAGPNVAAGISRTGGPQDAIVWTWSVVVVTLTPLFGRNVWTRRRAVADLEQQQRRNEEERAARAVLEERSRIARELHDVVAHNMSVIAIQAEAAPLRTPGGPAGLNDDFAAIRATALETLAEMRRVLGVLRAEGDDAETDPAPGIEQIGELVDKVSATGMQVTLSTAGAAKPVPPGVGVSAYRIVQESLSNAMRHAPEAPVTVRLAYEDGPAAIRITIENAARDVQPHDTTGARHGLVGMRERVAMLHGQLTTGPTEDGGFIVEALLPLESA